MGEIIAISRFPPNSGLEKATEVYKGVFRFRRFTNFCQVIHESLAPVNQDVLGIFSFIMGKASRRATLHLAMLDVQ
jgi:hypothetical protein